MPRKRKGAPEGRKAHKGIYHAKGAPIEAAGDPDACHIFRHTMATLMLENGADIRFIQAILGHAELSTTEIYTQVSIKQLKAVHTATHPARPIGEADNYQPADPVAEALLDALELEAVEEDASL